MAMERENSTMENFINSEGFNEYLLEIIGQEDPDATNDILVTCFHDSEPKQCSKYYVFEKRFFTKLICDNKWFNQLTKCKYRV